MENLASPRAVRDILARFGLAPHKQLGQNFLVDANVLEKIANAAGIEGRAVLEIGPGLGALTQRLAQRASRVVCVEIDGGFIPALQHTLAGCNNVEIIHGDILKQDWQTLQQKLGGVFSVCANLPYYITTPIIMRILESGQPWENICVLVQKEVGERMDAVPGGKSYGALSIAVQYYAETEQVCLVPPSCFIPPPKVESAVLLLRRRKERSFALADEARFFALTRAAFAMRRKTLVNNLCAAFDNLSRAQVCEALLACGLNENIRGEALDLADFARLDAQLWDMDSKQDAHSISYDK